MSSKTNLEIFKEAKRIEEDILYSEKSHFILANKWTKNNNNLCISIIILSIISAVVALGNFHEYIFAIGILTIIVTAISMIQLFLNPYEQSNSHQNAGVKYNTLRRKVRIFYNNEIENQNIEKNIDQLKNIADIKNNIDSESPKISRNAYEEARKGIENGEHEYEVGRL